MLEWWNNGLRIKKGSAPGTKSQIITQNFVNKNSGHCGNGTSIFF
jgi:hypothetical protein